MANVKIQKEMLLIAIGELRTYYRTVKESFEQLRTKALALLGGQIALITFVFASPTNLGATVPLYGLALFGLGIILLVAAAVLLLTVIAAVDWSHPMSPDDVADLKEQYSNDILKFLRYIKKDHQKSITYCVAKLNGRAKRFQLAMYMLIAGLFLVMVVKYGSNVVIGS